MTTGLLEKESFVEETETTIKEGYIIEFSNRNRMTLPLEFSIGNNETKKIEIIRVNQVDSSLFVMFITDKKTVYCEEISIYLPAMKSLATLFGFQTATVLNK